LETRIQISSQKPTAVLAHCALVVFALHMRQKMQNKFCCILDVVCAVYSRMQKKQSSFHFEPTFRP